jgi:hypothetical protein
MNVKLRPFEVPKEVRAEGVPGLRQDGFRPDNAWPLTVVDPHELSDMCTNFRKSVFKNAGKVDPLSIPITVESLDAILRGAGTKEDGDTCSLADVRQVLLDNLFLHHRLPEDLV